MATTHSNTGYRGKLAHSGRASARRTEDVGRGSSASSALAAAGRAAAVALSAPIRSTARGTRCCVPVREFRVRQFLALAPGQVIETQWGHGDDLPLAARTVQLAWSEFEVSRDAAGGAHHAAGVSAIVIERDSSMDIAETRYRVKDRGRKARTGWLDALHCVTNAVAAVALGCSNDPHAARAAALALLERITLAPRQSLALIEAEGRRLLVATSPEARPAFYPLDGHPQQLQGRMPARRRRARRRGSHGSASGSLRMAAAAGRPASSARPERSACIPRTRRPGPFSLF